MCPERMSCTKIEYKPIQFNKDDWCYLRPDTYKDVTNYVASFSGDRLNQVNITQNLLFGMTLGIYRLSRVGEYDPSSGHGGDTVGSYTRPGFAHCDINPFSLLFNYQTGVLQMTDFLGKQKLNEDDTYSKRMDACNGSGDPRYFSPRRSALYLASLLKNHEKFNNLPQEFQNVTEVTIDTIEKEYKNYRSQKIPLSTEDDLWSGLLSLYELCYPHKPLEAYLDKWVLERSSGIGHGYCTDKLLNAFGVDKFVCLKSLFYNQLNNENQRLPTYVYKNVNFKDYFNFDEKCEFPVFYGFTDKYTQAFDTELKENLEKYMRLLSADDDYYLKNLVEDFEQFIKMREMEYVVVDRFDKTD
eukprot:GHVR01067287.1.p1 GENE.GHVR01067287.1~~GHVR01067287.1.p1  ORF type:complete len:356 (-),score=59.32 GHVR01067287.1:364-1431(-)